MYAVYGTRLTAMKDELRKVLAKELAIGNLKVHEKTEFLNMRHKSLRVEVRGVQNNRLITVPMRFTVAHYPLDKELYEVRIPRLNKTFQIFGEENIDTWAEEIIRGSFHLKDVKELLHYQYEKNERFEPFQVVYHGAGRYKEKPYNPLEEWLEKFGEDFFGGSFMVSPLEQIGLNLTEEAREKRLERAFYREEQVQQLLKALSGRQNQSTLMIGPSGVGKTAILNEALYKLISENAPPRLQDVPVWHITGGRMIAGMKYLGQWQERCQQIANEIRAERGILYVDSLLELLMTGGQKSGLSVANFFLPYILSGELTLLAETTPAGLAYAERLNGPFVRALRKLYIPSLDTQDAFKVLERATKKLEREHGTRFSQPVIARALDVLARFGDVKALPGSGLTLLEQMSRLKPPTVKTVELEPADAIRAFSRSSGFPEDLINPDAKLNASEVIDFFVNRVKGQDHAMQLLTNLVLLIKASLNDPEKPLSSFLFMGPTGVGKTEAALTLAEYLFNDRKRVIRFDMSEFSYPGSGSRLVGGMDGQGELTRRVREQPFSIILLDELEKADPSVFDILLQVLGEGRLTDQTGQTVSFRHCIIIMTSNLGAARKKRLGFGDETVQHLEKHYLDAAEEHFRPEFINRIDFIVPFHDLSQEAIRAIARGMLDKAISREGFARRGIKVQYEDAVLDLLVGVGFNPKYGARPMKRAIERYVLIPLSRRLIRRSDQTEEILSLYLHGEQVAVYSDRGLRFGPTPLPTPLVFEHNNLWERYLREVRQRMLDWEESPLLKSLREREEMELPNRMRAVETAIQALEELSRRKPSLLSQENKALLTEQTAALSRQVYGLEWDLVRVSLPKTSSLSLAVTTPSLHPRGLQVQKSLVELYCRWAVSKGWAVVAKEERWKTLLTFSGPWVGALESELGVHRWIGEEDAEAIDVLVHWDEVDAAVPEQLIREYREEPATVWDVDTNEEYRGGIESMIADNDVESFERFLLARWMLRGLKEKSEVVAEG
jgi:ATP-dependent Clp protease ATP-binding subunit ClpC